MEKDGQPGFFLMILETQTQIPTSSPLHCGARYSVVILCWFLRQNVAV